MALLRCVRLHLHGNLENVGVGVVLVASQGKGNEWAITQGELTVWTNCSLTKVGSSDRDSMLVMIPPVSNVSAMRRTETARSRKVLYTLVVVHRNAHSVSRRTQLV